MTEKTSSKIYTLDELMSSFKRHDSDSGSPEVQIIRSSFKIAYLSRHLNEFPKDNSAKRTLIITVNARKRLVNYLKTQRLDVCKKLAEAIGIRGKF